jgi:hypothetical protein
LGVRHPGGGLFDIIGHPGNIAYFDRRPEEAALEEIEAGFLSGSEPPAWSWRLATSSAL